MELAILNCLPSIVMSKYSGSVRWFMLLISCVSNAESQGSIAVSCVNLLLKVVTEMEKRWDPYTTLLKTR